MSAKTALPSFVARALRASIGIAAVFCGVVAEADPRARSIVRLRGEQSCGTGFLLADGSIITNSHVSRGVCPFGVCSDLIAETAPSIGALPDTVLKPRYRVLRDIPSLDLAVLTPDSAPSAPRGTLQIAPIEAGLGTAIEVLGFPGCAELQAAGGAVSAVDEHRLSVSALVRRGNSGGPIVFGAAIVGVINQVESLSDALLSLFTSVGSPGRGITAATLMTITNDTADHLVERELELALSYYRNEVATKSGLARLRAGIDLLASTQAIAESALDAGVSDTTLRYLAFAIVDNGSLAAFPRLPTPKTALERAAAALSFATVAEYGGLRTPIGIPLDTAALAIALRERHGNDPVVVMVLDTIDELEAGGYSGFLWHAMAICALALIAGLMWAWSLGFVFGATRGGLFRRLWITAGVAIVVWPLSFLVYLFWRSRAKSISQRS